MTLHSTSGLGVSARSATQDCFKRSLQSKDRFLFHLAPAELAELEAIESRCSYPSGACLFLDQQKSRGIFLIHQGQVKMFFNSTQGKSLTLGIANAGDALGF